jgi:hypothetical protein
MTADTTLTRLLQRALLDPDEPAYYELASGSWQPTSWAGYSSQVTQAGQALMAEGAVRTRCPAAAAPIRDHARSNGNRGRQRAELGCLYGGRRDRSHVRRGQQLTLSHLFSSFLYNCDPSIQIKGPIHGQIDWYYYRKRGSQHTKRPHHNRSYCSLAQSELFWRMEEAYRLVRSKTFLTYPRLKR